MSTAKRALKKQVALQAITHGKEQPRKLPETLALARSQALALTALNNDEQRLSREIQERQVALQATGKARLEVLGEIAKAHSITVEELGATYRFDGNQLFQPTE